MALEHWIKVEKITPDKPEMAILAEKLGISIPEAFLAFFRLYCWADSMTKDGNVAFLSLKNGDKCRSLFPQYPGLLEALASKEIGWIKENENGGFTFSNWERHNGESAKKRLIKAERKQLERQKKEEAQKNQDQMSHHEGDKCRILCATNVAQNVRPENRVENREDINKNKNACANEATFDPRINPPTTEQVCTEAANRGIVMTIQSAEAFIEYWRGAGWETKGTYIRDWRFKLKSWQERGREIEAGKQSKAKKPFNAADPSTWETVNG